MKLVKLDTNRFYLEVGEKVRAVRKAAGMDQENLARHLGLSRTTIINIEKGRQRLSLEQAWLISHIFEISITNLLPPSQTNDIAAWEEKVENSTHIKDEIQRKIVLDFISKTLKTKKT